MIDWTRVIWHDGNTEDTLPQRQLDDLDLTNTTDTNDDTSDPKGTINKLISFIQDHFQIVYCPTQAKIVDFHTEPLQGHAFCNIKKAMLGIAQKDVETYDRDFIEILMVFDPYDDSIPL